MFVKTPPVRDATPSTITINKPVTKDYLLSEALTLDFDARALKVSLASSANLFVTDPQGRIIGLDPSTGQIVNEIPNATYSGITEPQVIMIPDLAIGNYDVTLLGNSTGNYTLTIEYITAEQTVTQTFNGTISKQEKQYYSALLTEAGEMTTISWEYIFEDTKRDTILKISTDDQYFQFVAPNKTFPVKHHLNMIATTHFIFINYGDSEIVLRSIAIITRRWSFCIAIATDVETGTRHLLIDVTNPRGVQWVMQMLMEM